MEVIWTKPIPTGSGKNIGRSEGRWIFSVSNLPLPSRPYEMESDTGESRNLTDSVAPSE